MSNITLNYWSGRGLMEVTRVMLALSGKFPPADYEDGRYPFGPIPKHVNLAANNGRLPVANIGGVEIGQSIGIWYYFAAELGFLGKNNLEAAQILAVVETIKEVITEFGKLFPCVFFFFFFFIFLFFIHPNHPSFSRSSPTSSTREC